MYAINNKSQRGNVLFLILIAVALFAALSYAVTASTRSGSQNSNNETIDLQISQIHQYSAALSAAIQRLQVINKCDTSELNFYSTLFTNPADYNNASAPIDSSCDVFHPNGGRIPWREPPEMLQNAGSSEYLITGSLQISGIGTDQGGTNLDQELLLMAIVNREICLRINDKEGITNPGGNPPHSNSKGGYSIPPTALQDIGGGFVDDETLAVNPATAPEIYGQVIGCYHHNNQNHYFYNVLLAR